MRGALVTAAGPTMRQVLYEVSLPSFRRYAERWELEVRVEDLPGDGAGADPAAQRAKWAKIELLRAALTEFPFAVWFDADVLIVRDDDDIARHLHPRHFQALALEQVPHEHRVNPNTGVWLLRSNSQAFDFLDAVHDAGPQPGPWADQGAVLAALGWNRGDENYHWAGPGIGNEFLTATSWLSPAWNQPYLDGRTESTSFNSAPQSYANRPIVDRPFAVHFMGMTPGARHKHMAAMANRTRPNSRC